MQKSWVLYITSSAKHRARHIQNYWAKLDKYEVKLFCKNILSIVQQLRHTL